MKYGASNIQPERVRTQKAKWRAYLGRRAAAATKVARVVPTWTWERAGGGGTVKANTRSEAKGLVKEILGINKGRLPKEVTVVAQAK